MKKLILYSIYLSLLFIFSSISYAQKQISEEKKQLISELIVLTKMDKQTAEITDTLLASMETPYLSGFNVSIEKRTDLTDAQKEAMKASVKVYFANFSSKFRRKMSESIDYSKYIESSVYPLYDKFYTVEELKDLTAFYRTPTGKKVIETMPALYKEALEMSHKNLLPDVLRLMEEILREDLDALSKPSNKN